MIKPKGVGNTARESLAVQTARQLYHDETPFALREYVKLMCLPHTDERAEYLIQVVCAYRNFVRDLGTRAVDQQFKQLRICIVLEYWYQRNCALSRAQGWPLMPRSRMFSDTLPFEKTMLYYDYFVDY